MMKTTRHTSVTLRETQLPNCAFAKLAKTRVPDVVKCPDELWERALVATGAKYVH